MGTTTTSILNAPLRNGQVAHIHVLQSRPESPRAKMEELELATCFAAGTLIHTKAGLKPIEGVEVGDLVLTYPEDQPQFLRA